MANVSEILKVAHQRGRELGLSYEGALMPREAFDLLQQTPNAILVDVRTDAELSWVGYVPNAIHVEWMTWPAMEANEHFLEELKKRVSEDSVLVFLCRSGARSNSAAQAATEAGFPSCYNVLHGFEGDRDADLHRNAMNGWRAAGLPWEQN
jgi:rhodanese-related sulfurtransferase